MMLRGAIQATRTAPIRLRVPLSATIAPVNLYGGVRHVYTPRTQSRPPPNVAPKRNGPAGPSNTGNTSAYRPSKPEEPPRKPRDLEIPFRKVRLVDPETGALGPLTELRDVIAFVQSRPGHGEEVTEATSEKKDKWKKRWCVELVSEVPDPIVRAVNLSEEYRKAKEARKKKKESDIKEKEVQMSWSVGQGDMQHKFKKIREALDEGDRVTIVFLRKKGQPFPEPAEMQAKMQEAMDQLADIAVEWKPRALLPNRTGFIYIQNKA